MKAKTAAAIIEMAKIASKEFAGVEDDGRPITVTIRADRNYDWCGLQDDYVEVTEDEFATRSLVRRKRRLFSTQ